MEKYAFIASGAVLGAFARYGIINIGVGSLFPWATLLVNVLGCLAGGLFWQLSAQDPSWSRFSPLVMVGFMGSFTTFSALAVESAALVRIGQMAVASAYVGASIVLCQVAVFLGMWIGSRL